MQLQRQPYGGMRQIDAVWRDLVEIPDDVPRSGAPWVRKDPDRLATAALLARAGLFRACSAKQVGELAASVYQMSFTPGSQLCVEGTEALECYVIAAGEAAVAIGGWVVGTVGENDVVGERGPLEDRARSATVIATTDLTVYAIPRHRLLHLVATSPTAAKWMFDYLRCRYAE